MKHPIVILHGWGLSAKTFAPLVSELRKQHLQVFAPDLPGFESLHIPTRPYTLSDYAEYVHSYVQKHNLDKVVIIGHSFGGRVALKFQHTYPQKIAGLVLTGTPGFTPVSRRRLAIFISIAKVGGALMSLPILYRFKDKVRLWAYYIAGARDFYRAEGVMRDTFKNVVKEPLLNYMKSVRVSTLLVWGEWDVIVPVAIAYKMKDVIPGVRLTILPHTGHDVPYKSPKAFTGAILPWLQTL